MNKNQPNKKLRIAVMADIHYLDTSRGSYADAFAAMSDEADLVVLCGDITNTGSIVEAEHLLHDARSCRIPILAVLGNHDHESDKVDELKRLLSPTITFLEDVPYQKDGVGFAGVKGFGGGFDSFMLGHFGEKPTKDFVNAGVQEALKLENQLRNLHTERIVVVLHYSPIAATVHGEPAEIMPFLGCSRLGETIDRFPVTLAVHGHAHNGTFEGKTNKGIPVYNCAQEILSKKFKKPYYVFEV